MPVRSKARFALRFTLAGVFTCLFLGLAVAAQTRRTPPPRRATGLAPLPSGPVAPPSATSQPSSEPIADDGLPNLVATKPPSKKSAGTGSKDDVGVDLDKELARKKKNEKKPDYEIKSIRAAPSDNIPFLKPNHWTLLHVNLVANNGDFSGGEIHTHHELIPGTTQEVRVRRLVQLTKGQVRSLRMPIFVPEIDTPKRTRNIQIGLYAEDGVMPMDPPGLENHPLIALGQDQFLIMVLAAKPDDYNYLNNYQCVLPGAEDDGERGDQRRYYFLINSAEPNKPLLSEHPLAWSPISFAIWDGLQANSLLPAQQESMLDWLHWGGVLLVSGGAEATSLRQSFLGPYLPADVGPSLPLKDLDDLSERYPAEKLSAVKAKRLNRVQILPNRPVYAVRLDPRPDRQVRVTVQTRETPLVVERAVGRGRIVMTAFSLTQPELMQWSGYERFWREALLHTPESVVTYSADRTYHRVPARYLSSVRYTARDLFGGWRRQIQGGGATLNRSGVVEWTETGSSWVDTIAEWRDSNPLPQAARDTLLESTGIKVPPPQFVLTAALGYAALMLTSWLVCLFLVRRPELTWVAAPAVTVLFCVGIFQLAQQNVGFDMSVREIDVVEAYAGHPRAHVSRFTCVYSGTRRRCEFQYNEPTAVAMPMSRGPVARGSNLDRMTLTWGLPSTLGRYQIHPRSIGMVRAEEVRNIAPGFSFQPAKLAADTAEIVSGEIKNESGWSLNDCWVITPDGWFSIGEFPRGSTAHFAADRLVVSPLKREDDLRETARQRNETAPDIKPTWFHVSDETRRTLEDVEPRRVLELVARGSMHDGARLVGWTPLAVPGQEIDPKPDRTAGFTVFVVHLDIPLRTTVPVVAQEPKQEELPDAKPVTIQ
jgi:hypothetical protein